MDSLNQQSTPSSSPMPQSAPMTSAPKMTSPVMNASAPKKVGPIVAILVVVLILVIGALYLFASKMNQAPAVPTDTNVAGSNADTSMAPQTVQPVTNKSTDVNSLQADLNASTQGLDAQNF